MIQLFLTYVRECARPWKLITFAVAMAWLLWGAANLGVSDWDIGVTLLVGTLTYLTAPWSLALILRAIRSRPPRWLLHMFVALGMGILVIDTAYVAYHTLVGNIMLRRENFIISYPLYYLAGAFWLYRGSLRDLVGDVRSLTPSQRH